MRRHEWQQVVSCIKKQFDTVITIQDLQRTGDNKHLTGQKTKYTHIFWKVDEVYYIILYIFWGGVEVLTAVLTLKCCFSFPHLLHALLIQGRRNKGGRGSVRHPNNFAKNDFFSNQPKTEFYTAICVHWSGDDNGNLRSMELRSVNSIVFTSESGVYIPVSGVR